MAYIGNTTQVANSSYRIVDDISSGFNGVTTSFAFRVSGTTPIPFPLNPQNCIISVNNVLLKPDVTTVEGFWFSGANIVFKVAPTSGHKFWGVILAGADYVTAGSLNPDGVAAAPSVTFYSSTGTGLFLLGANTLGISTNGAQRLAINGSGAIGIGGTSFGTSGQVLASNGSGAAPSWQAPLTGASISIGDTSAVVSDTGTDGAFTVTTDGSAKLTINNFGAFGIGGSSFGTNGQIFTSGGAGSAPTWQTPAVVSTISVGNTNATVTDTGTNGTFTVTTENAARLTINSSGAFGVGGNNFGTSGQILTSNGPTAVPSWQAAPAGASILVGNTSATVTDTGIDGAFTVVTEANTRLIINSSGAFGLGGSNFGTSGQVLTSNGSTAVPSWQTTTNTSIAVGNTSATVTDTGSDGTFTVTTEGVSRLTVSSTGLVSLSGNLAVTGTTTLTGTPTAPTAPLNTNTTQIATTAFVATAISSKANLAGPDFTGTPTAPTAALNTNTTQLATTAFVAAAVALKANLASPNFTGTPTALTAAVNTNTTQIATTAFVSTAVSNKSDLTRGDAKITVFDLTLDGQTSFRFTTGILTWLIVNGNGAFGLGGSNFGTTGQVFTSNGSAGIPYWQSLTTIAVGNTSATVTDTGSDGAFTVTTEGSDRLTINSSGAFGIGGSNFGTSNQILTSGGSGAAPSWQDFAAVNKSTPVTYTASSVTIASTDYYVFLNNASTQSVTLPLVSTNTGRKLILYNLGNGVSSSASSNVSINGGVSGRTALFAFSTPGKWLTLVSNGTYWCVVQSVDQSP